MTSARYSYNTYIQGVSTLDSQGGKGSFSHLLEGQIHYALKLFVGRPIKQFWMLFSLIFLVSFEQHVFLQFYYKTIIFQNCRGLCFKFYSNGGNQKLKAWSFQLRKNYFCMLNIDCPIAHQSSIAFFFYTPCTAIFIDFNSTYSNGICWVQ